MTSLLDVELKREDANDCISCFDEEVLDEFKKPILSATLDVEIAFGGSSGCNSCSDNEALRIESIKLEVTVSLGV